MRKLKTSQQLTRNLKAIFGSNRILHCGKGDVVFAQGDPAPGIYFIESGRVKISVVRTRGKEGVLAMLGCGDFFGEGCLIGQPVRVNPATATEPTSLFAVEKQDMLEALYAQPRLSEKFTAYLLKRKIELEEDRCDQLFNNSEKRLARVLLKLARLRERDVLPDARIPTMSHRTLAGMVGTSRSRITAFMNKFRKLGLIDYDGEKFTVRPR